MARPSATPSNRARRSRRWRYRLGRIPSRAVLLVAFAMAVVAAGVAILPFAGTSDTGVELRCGPPLYELLVPADPAFDVPENKGCASPARQHLLVAGFMGGLAFVAAAMVNIRRRHDNRYHWGPWLAGSNTRRRARRSSGKPPGSKRDGVSGVDVGGDERLEGGSRPDGERAGTLG